MDQSPQADATMGLEAAAVVASEGCRWCKGPLSGRQTAFCSKACNGRWQDAEHPRINRGEAGPREGTLPQAIIAFLKANPGEWTKRQIADAIHGFEHSVGTRLAALIRAGQPIGVRRGPGNVKLYRWLGE